MAAAKLSVVLGEESLGLGQGDHFLVAGVDSVVSRYLVSIIYTVICILSTFQKIHPSADLALWKLSSPVSTNTYTVLGLPTQVKHQASYSDRLRLLH